MFKEITEIGKIDHIGIAVTDLATSINHYSNLLNFNNLPAVIVIPDLLTPGIRERV